MDEEEERQQQYLANRDAIFMLLCSGHYCYLSDRMQMFYQIWNKMTELQRKTLGEYVACYMPARHASLYESLVQVFNFWDKTQESVGAPGWDCREDLVYLENTDLENEIRQVLYTTESLWRKFNKLPLQSSSQSDEPSTESESEPTIDAGNGTDTYAVELKASPKSLDVSIGMNMTNNSAVSKTSNCCRDTDGEDLKEEICRCSEIGENKKKRCIEEDLQYTEKNSVASTVRKSYSAELLR